MNKQELIEKIEALPAHNTRTRPWIDKNLVLGLVRQLDEPQKPVVPQFVDALLGFAKLNFWDLEDIFEDVRNESRDTEISKWFYQKKNMDILARAWLDGYEVEKEPKYKVKLKNTDDYLNQTETGFHFFNNWKNNEKFTRKELEYYGFGEVFNSPLFEVEEVE